MQTLLNILSVPAELLLVILRYLHPLDILSLRRTCKDLALLTYDYRELWRDALVDACVMHDAFLPGFIMEEMEREALECAVLTPYRFTSLLRKSEDQVLGPSFTRIVPPLTERGADATTTTNTPEPEELQITPYLMCGGRFLFVVEKVGSRHSIHLVDLGIIGTPALATSGSTIGVRLPSAFLDYEGLFTRVFVSLVDPRATATRDDEDASVHKIRLFTNTLTTDFVRKLCVYEIYPLSKTPVFKHIATLTSLETNVLDTDWDLFAIQCYRDRLALLTGHTIVVWDFVEGMMAAWMVDDDDPDETDSEISDITITDDFVFLFRDDLVCERWKIPTLGSIQDFSGARARGAMVPDGTYTLTSPILASSTLDYRFLVSLVQVPSGAGPRPFRLVYLSKTKEEIFLLHHFNLENPRRDAIADTDSNNISPKLTFLGEESTPSIPSSSYYHSHFCGDDSSGDFLQVWLTNDDELVVTVSNRFVDSPIPSEGLRENRVVRLWKPEKPNNCRLGFDYCPMAARFCVVTRGGEILVMDF